MTEQERFERYKAAERGIEYERFKLIRDIHEETYGVRYHQLTQMASDWKIWQAATSQAVPEQSTFQSSVKHWLLECFGEMIANNIEERNHRFLEESLELVQSTGCTASEAHQLVDYVFNRPVGEPTQEVGGVMVTLAALCLANKLNMYDAGETELSRINQPESMLKIRAKQEAKPKHSPLAEKIPASTGKTTYKQIGFVHLKRWQAGNSPEHCFSTEKELYDDVAIYVEDQNHD